MVLFEHVKIFSKIWLNLNVILSETKPYQCQFCPTKFRTVGHRKAHEQSHLKGNKSKKSKAEKINSLLSSIALDTNLITQKDSGEEQLIGNANEDTVFIDNNMVRKMMFFFNCLF